MSYSDNDKHDKQWSHAQLEPEYINKKSLSTARSSEKLLLALNTMNKTESIRRCNSTIIYRLELIPHPGQRRECKSSTTPRDKRKARVATVIKEYPGK